MTRVSVSARITLGVLLVLLASAIAVSIGMHAYLQTVIVTTIQGTMKAPSAINQAQVAEGRPIEFLLDDTAARLVLSPETVTRLLAQPVVLDDCNVAGRTCHSPTWGHYPLGMDLTVRLPEEAQSHCAWSYETGSYLEEGDVHLICLDQQTSSLYFYEWSLGGR